MSYNKIVSNDTIYDYVIIGGGIVGLCLAHQLLEKNSNASLAILDKEDALGKHTSGRNSGVLHAGIYYKPDTLKAKVSVKGAKILKEWCNEESIPVLTCGKVISPQLIELDPQLDILLARGKKNGAKVDLIDRIKKVDDKIVPVNLTKVFAEIGKVRELIAMIPPRVDLTPILEQLKMLEEYGWELEEDLEELSKQLAITSKENEVQDAQIEEIKLQSKNPLGG